MLHGCTTQARTARCSSHQKTYPKLKPGKIRQWEERKKQRTNPVHEVADEVEFTEEQQQDVQASCTDLEIQKKQ